MSKQISKSKQDELELQAKEIINNNLELAKRIHWLMAEKNDECLVKRVDIDSDYRRLMNIEKALIEINADLRKHLDRLGGSS